MDNNRLSEKYLNDSNYSSLSDLTTFAKLYIEKLVYNVITYVDSKIQIGTIEILNNYSGDYELSQEITGIPGAYSCIDGSKDALSSFAKVYTDLEISSFDMLTKEILVDFLNLHNGLFVVLLSNNNICELSLDVPKQNGNYNIDNTKYKSIIVIPILFSFGKINFLLCEL